MANEAIPPMHADFPLWYREVGIDENRDRLQRRWNGVATFVRGMTDKGWEDALRVVFRAKAAPTEEGIGQIRKIFKEADEMFDMHGNDREVEILCAASLAVLIERNDNVAAAGALATSTAAFSGARTAELPMDLRGLAEIAIKRIAEENRKRPNLQQVLGNVSPVSFAAAKEKLQQWDQNGVGAAFDVAGTAVAATLENLRKQLGTVTERTGKFIAIQDEELEMLWWVFGERSEALNLPFKDVGAKAQPLVFGKELADATKFLPGPGSAEGLLQRAGLKDNKKISIPEAVNAADTSWLKSSMPSTAVSPLTRPIHFAIGRKLETNDDNAWIAGWASSSGIDEKQSFSALTLGTLFYRERLLSAAGRQ